MSEENIEIFIVIKVNGIVKETKVFDGGHAALFWLDEMHDGYEKKEFWK